MACWFCRRLHGRFCVVARQVGEPAYGLWGVGWPRQCRRPVVERVVEVVVPHGLGLHVPGIRGFWCVRAAWRSLSPVECCVEGFPRSAFPACQGGGLDESLRASWRVFLVDFWGVGLGCHEASMCPVEDPGLGVRFEDVNGGLLGGRVQGVPQRDG